MTPVRSKRSVNSDPAFGQGRPPSRNRLLKREAPDLGERSIPSKVKTPGTYIRHGGVYRYPSGRPLTPEQECRTLTGWQQPGQTFMVVVCHNRWSPESRKSRHAG